MIRLLSHTTKQDIEIRVHPRAALAARRGYLTDFVRQFASNVPLSWHPAWLDVFQTAFGHETYAIEAVSEGRTYGYLPLAHVSSLLFGKFLVSLPYLNTNGVLSDSADVQAQLITRAVNLAEELNVKYLELRHESPVDHPDLNATLTSKVHMRLALPPTSQILWKEFDPKVRNQIRKGEKQQFRAAWGGLEFLDGFYEVLSENMRDLGTPVYGKSLFREILATFPGDSEICLMTADSKPVAAALLLHGWGVTEVPTASSLKGYNSTCVNMLMYWHLIERAIDRGQEVFDFGRSTIDGGTYRFKKQWGAKAFPAVWQYCVLGGEETTMRPENRRYQLAIRVWQHLPIQLTRLLGPLIVRGIP